MASHANSYWLATQHLGEMLRGSREVRQGHERREVIRKHLEQIALPPKQTSGTESAIFAMVMRVTMVGFRPLHASS